MGELIKLQPEVFIASLDISVARGAVELIRLYSLEQSNNNSRLPSNYWAQNSIYDLSPHASELKAKLQGDPYCFNFELIYSIRIDPYEWIYQTEVWLTLYS